MLDRHALRYLGRTLHVACDPALPLTQCNKRIGFGRSAHKCKGVYISVLLHVFMWLFTMIWYCVYIRTYIQWNVCNLAPIGE